ncbi:MAG TPA: DUF885 domain-containing protein [Steroidobacteraceae bacterium]|nr:DUF885 domain-containing protein [Steroidobacteraceae bacterium]
MKKVWKVLGWIGLAVLLVGGYAGYRIGFGKPFTINELANRQLIVFLVRNPEVFTQVGLVDGTIFDRHSGKLADVGVKKRDDDYALAGRFVSEVKQFDRAQLDRQDQITYDILLDQFETQLAFKRFDWLSSEGLYPIAPMWGTQVQLPSFLETAHVVRNGKTAHNYVKRLEAMGGKLDGLIAEMERQAKAGVVLPVSLLDKAEAGISDTVSPKPEDNPLVTTFVERMKTAKGLEAAEQTELAHQAAAAVRDGIYPAYARMTAALEIQRPAAATQGAGVGRLPDGAAYYAESLRQMTTTDYTPEEVHQLGLREVARIDAELDALLKSQGLTAGTVAERIRALRADPRFLVSDSDEGRKQLLTRYQHILDEVSARLPEYFRTLPPTKLTVERVPLAAEKGSAMAYYQPGAMDGTRPGTFFANLRDVQETPTWVMKTLAYHEGIPGHHFQISIAQNLKDLPLLRQQTLYTAYAEGWALYAERLASEMGMYKDDPFGDIGRLRDEMLRAVRLVVDTGLHAEGWSHDQAVDYMVKTTGMPESEVITEVERYMGAPGQACAYKVGQLKILELREKARAALGPRFNLKDFHAVVLENGGVPLTLLEKLVDEWIAKTRG